MRDQSKRCLVLTPPKKSGFQSNMLSERVRPIFSSSINLEQDPDSGRTSTCRREVALF